jgi:hypothetical protein
MKGIYTFLFVVSIIGANAQSKTTEALAKKYDAQSFFFYNNTLRMLNQSEDPAFDEVIKDIEKMKLLMIKKDAKSLSYQQVLKDYKSDSFEEVMTSRHEGKNFDVFLKEKDKKTTGMLVLINDSTSLFVLDIVGSIALNKVTSLYNTLGKSADFGKKIREFTDGGKD